jgi:mono/diheme cytochrome c family protein
MKTKICLSMLMALSVAIFLHSCETEDAGENETKNSSHGSNESHNMGQNCMNCHQSGGSGEGWFTIAGTVYDSIKTNTFSNATINFYSGLNASGDIKYTIQGDELGNFYTTQNIDFSNGLYVSVAGDKTTKVMSSKITAGQCNSCHGSTTGKIWTR